MLSPATVNRRSLVLRARASLGTGQSRSHFPQCLIYCILDKETKKTLSVEDPKGHRGRHLQTVHGRGEFPAGWTLACRTPPCGSRAPPGAFWATGFRVEYLPRCLVYFPALCCLGMRHLPLLFTHQGPVRTWLVFRSFLHKSSKENLNFGIF